MVIAVSKTKVRGLIEVVEVIKGVVTAMLIGVVVVVCTVVSAEVKRFYAILRGRETGIFNSWQQVEVHVKGFKGAIHHSFKNLEDAQAYMKRSSYMPARPPGF